MCRPHFLAKIPETPRKLSFKRRLVRGGIVFGGGGKSSIFSS